MMLRHSFELEREATCIETAVSAALNQGHRTADLARAEQTPISTSEMGSRVVAELQTCLSGNVQKAG